MTAEEIVAAALALPPAERLELAAEILKSLPELTEQEWEESWAKECERRLAALREGRTTERPADDVFREARARRG